MNTVHQRVKPSPVGGDAIKTNGKKQKSKVYPEVPLESMFGERFGLGVILWQLLYLVATYYVVSAAFLQVRASLPSLTHFQLIVVSPIVVHMLVFWPGAFFYWVLELTGSPRLLTRFKIQPSAHSDLKKHLKCAAIVLCNQLFVLIPLQYFAYDVHVLVGTSVSTELPSLFEILRCMAICLAAEEIIFYYSHRALHYGPLYRFIHKMHHDFKAPIATASEYAHPIEFAFSNVIPIMVGILVSGCHLVIVWFWIAVAIMNTLTGHSGYCFPWSPFGDARRHDYHHESFRDNYGALGILDWLHGTGDKYLEHLDDQRQHFAKVSANAKTDK
mmetsp:Transcript_8239/g.20753  ORF Transcript_8239/g.20753 Transcript_8239/m.20753 type:complete len:329 (-) Transcript_8239:32-1018(-)|eukprot:CAMPEP_0177664298 /NCGR_PEP_ID=MMETSP0447-20121125/20412_1 /TAXON_ID=0 /ORGANISM="Stygamoeba regulata, Strain BSH-02190019" /LENGTH=328 /DNA_ID=CAMNT_0019170247 /DNA_START=63 /DNA_END=1049 /DNA_ORIENTATION=+